LGEQEAGGRRRVEHTVPAACLLPPAYLTGVKSFSPTAQFVAKPGLVTTDLESELILLDPDSQQMYSLNPTGRLIWQKLEGCTLEQLVEAVSRAFEVDQKTALTDASALLADLLQTGLITLAADGD